MIPRNEAFPEQNLSGIANSSLQSVVQTPHGSQIPTVSMAVYNAEGFLANAINSVLNQTYSNFEFVIVDDGSTDGSAGILAQFARTDPRVRVIRQPNGGPAAAANTGLRAAIGDIVMKFDSDDIMMPDRIERQLAFMLEHPEVSVSTSWAYLVDSEGRTVGKSHPQVDVDLGKIKRDPSYFVNIIHPASVMRKSHVLEVGGYSPNFRFGEDRELWGRLVTSGRTLAVQPEYLLKQRLHGGSLTLDRMQTNELACRYIDANIVRRLDGLAELSYEEFLRARAERPLHARIQSWIDDASSMLYKRATRDYAERRWFSLVRHSLGAIALRPSNALRMLRKSASAPSERPLLHQRG